MQRGDRLRFFYPLYRIRNKFRGQISYWCIYSEFFTQFDYTLLFFTRIVSISLLPYGIYARANASFAP